MVKGDEVSVNARIVRACFADVWKCFRYFVLIVDFFTDFIVVHGHWETLR